MKKLLHEIEAAQEVLGVGRTTIYNLAKKGELKLVKIGARTLVTDASLEAFVAQLRPARLQPKPTPEAA